MKSTLLHLILSIVMLSPALAQDEAPNYPQDYFRNPLDIPIFLAGNFGECRPGHFHSGCDIKTLGKENQPVHAAAAGYISRIKMERGGFGHALYITHPNGYTTLYAHLNDFAPAIQEYLVEQQYEKKRWDVDLQLSPSQFAVEKGQQIAWSGNTGASTAPHLHFEIRSSKTEHPLNPELFGLPVSDNIPPVPKEVVLYNYDGRGIYNANTTTLTLAKVGNSFHPIKISKGTLNKDTLYLQSDIFGIAINADDYMDGSDNNIAFYTAKVYLDDSLQSEVILDDIGYDETRYINAYFDYKTKFLNNKWVQLLFRLPGNKLDHIFHHMNEIQGWKGNGWLDMRHDGIYKISIVITDDKQNNSTIEFFINTDLANTNRAYKGCEATDSFYTYNTKHTFNSPNVNFTLDERQLYDNICFHFNTVACMNGYSDQYMVGQPYIPVHHYFDLSIKPTKPIPFNLRSKMVMMYSDGKNIDDTDIASSKDGRPAKLGENGWYVSSVRNFGIYWLQVDTTAPVIKSLQKNNANLSKARQITFEVTENKTSVRSFSGYLDGKWICFEQHNNLFFYKFDKHCPKGKHELVFKAEDENGNESKYKLSFTR